MVILWTIGDTLRLVYYIYKNQPIQFKIGSGISALIDMYVLGQIFVYRQYDKRKGKGMEKAIGSQKQADI